MWINADSNALIFDTSTPYSNQILLKATTQDTKVKPLFLEIDVKILNFRPYFIEPVPTEPILIKVSKPLNATETLRYQLPEYNDNEEDSKAGVNVRVLNLDGAFMKFDSVAKAILFQNIPQSVIGSQRQIEVLLTDSFG